MKRGRTRHLPPDIWEGVAEHLTRPVDLAALARVCKSSHYAASALLFHTLEVSPCKASPRHCGALLRTLTTSQDLARLVKVVILDARLPCLAGAKVPNDRELSKWQGAASRAVQNCGFIEKALPHLKSIESFQFIRGSAPNRTEAQFPTTPQLGQLYGNQLRELRLHDTPLKDNDAVFGCFSSLVSLDLGYSDMDDEDLCVMLNLNSSTLESLALVWLIQPPPRAFFGTGDNLYNLSLPRLRKLHVEGYMRMHDSGTAQLLQSCPSLARLELADISDPAAETWARVLPRLVENGALRGLAHVAFGGPKTTARAWWDAVASFLDHLRPGALESLAVHAHEVGLRLDGGAAMPACLRDVLLRRPGAQPNVRTLIVIWRAVPGMDYASVAQLAETFPGAELVHIYTSYPADPAQLKALLDAVAAFACLRRLHIVTPRQDSQNADKFWRSPKPLGARAGKNYPFADEFLLGVSQRCALLERVSWIQHKPWSEVPEDCVFAQIKRSDSGTLKFVDLTEKHFRKSGKAQKAYPFAFEGSKVVLDEKPGWLGDMKNPMLQDGSICARAYIRR